MVHAYFCWLVCLFSWTLQLCPSLCLFFSAFVLNTPAWFGHKFVLRLHFTGFHFFACTSSSGFASYKTRLHTTVRLPRGSHSSHASPFTILSGHFFTHTQTTFSSRFTFLDKFCGPFGHHRCWVAFLSVTHQFLRLFSWTLFFATRFVCNTTPRFTPLHDRRFTGHVLDGHTAFVAGGLHFGSYFSFSVAGYVRALPSLRSFLNCHVPTDRASHCLHHLTTGRLPATLRHTLHWTPRRNAAGYCYARRFARSSVIAHRSFGSYIRHLSSRSPVD